MVSSRAVHVWVVPLDAGSRFAADAAWERLTPDERKRAECFHQAGDRDRFVTGRGALRALLADALPGGRDVTLEAEPGGRLVAPGSGLHVSVAHSAGLVLCAVAGRPVGVDVEHVAGRDPEPALLQRSCTAAELREVLATGAADRELAFLRIWTRKEAVGKALGVGLALPLTEVDVRRRMTVAGLPHAGRWRVRTLAVPPGYVAAVAARGAAWRATVHRVPGRS